MTSTHASFSGSIPEYYDHCLGPAWFDPFAADLAARLPRRPPGDVVEIACGTGLVTRQLRERLDPSVRIVATDLSKAMLDYARDKSALSNVEWCDADAMQLPFADGQFAAAVCGFGLMFMPDKHAALAQARRVLGAGGTLLLNTWDGIEANRHAAACAEVVESLFPGDPEMRFTTPYELRDPELIRDLLAQARFEDVRIDKTCLPLGRVSARSIALGQIRGTPRSLLFEKRGVSLDDMVDKVAAALTRVGGADPYVGTAQAVVVEARRGA
ncbi:MAG TPA: methyltransferase domain-containing protein [Casimicrobiaceae bacterium]|nr:methyltransferase domain-containing protein [Casimicrobiaceae bacterium]